MTFIPSFDFVVLEAPHVERLRGNRRLSAALTGIAAAVVGVIALGLELPVIARVRPSPSPSWRACSSSGADGRRRGRSPCAGSSALAAGLI